MDNQKNENKLLSEIGGSALFQGFEFVEGAGPVCAQEAGEASVCENLSSGLALGAVVCLVVGVADALYRLAAGGAWPAEAAVDSHVVAEGGDFLGEVATG